MVGRQEADHDPLGSVEVREVSPEWEEIEEASHGGHDQPKAVNADSRLIHQRKNK